MGFICNIVPSCMFLPIYIRVSKNAIECVDFSWSKLMKLYIVFKQVRNLFNFASNPVYVMNMSFIYLVQKAIIFNFQVDVF